MTGPAAPSPGEARRPVPIRATGYLRLHVPPDAPTPAPAVVALHGYGQPPRRMFRYARSVAPPGAVVVAPEGPQAFYAEPWRPDVARRRVGYGWVADRPRDDAEARNRDLLARALDAAQAEHALDAARTCLLAYSQGVGVAADFAVHARERVSGLVGLAGGVPEKARASLAALAGLPVLWISGRRDPYYAPAYNDAVVAAWRAARVDLTTEVLDRGHDVLEPARERVRAWIAAQGCAGTGPGSAVP